MLSVVALADLLGRLHDEGLVDVGDHTTAGDGGLDQGIQFLVTSDGQLQVSWCNSLHLQVLRSIACELEHLGSEVLEDGCGVDGGSGTDSAICIDSALEQSVDSSNWELNYEN